MLNEKEKKRVIQQCIYPSIAIASLIISLGIGLFWILFVMIDDLFLNAESFYSLGLYVYLGIVVVFMVVYLYCTLSLKLGKKNRAFWDSIVQKVNASQFNENHSGKVAASIGLSAAGKMMHQSNHKNIQNLGTVSQIAGAASAVDAAADVSMEQYRNGAQVAKAVGIPIPKAKKYVIPILLFPILLLTAVYVPEWIHTKNTWQAYTQHASVNLSKVQKVFEQNYNEVSADDPLEKTEDSYQITGYVEGYSREKRIDHITVSFDKEGKVDSVYYCKEVDRNVSMEENLKQAQDEFNQMNEVLVGSGVETLDLNLLENHTLSTEFQEQFKAGTYYKEVSVWNQKGHVFQSNRFDTEKEDEFDEYTRPSIILYVSYKKNAVD